MGDPIRPGGTLSMSRKARDQVGGGGGVAGGGPVRPPDPRDGGGIGGRGGNGGGVAAVLVVHGGGGGGGYRGPRSGDQAPGGPRREGRADADAHVVAPREE